MEEFASFFGIVAADTAIEKNKNQITPENFVVQASEYGILSKKHNCATKYNDVSVPYFALYNYLLEHKVINYELKKDSIFTLDYVYTINTTNVNEPYIAAVFSQNNRFPEPLTCYDVDIKKLLKFLQNYQYSAADQFKFLEKIGKKQPDKAPAATRQAAGKRSRYRTSRKGAKRRRSGRKRTYNK